MSGGLLAGWSRSVLTSKRTCAAAVAQERRRIAADVHDLIMQDLSLALANARALLEAHVDPAHSPHASAAVAAGERALDAARTLVRDLSDQAREDPAPITRGPFDRVPFNRGTFNRAPFNRAPFNREPSDREPLVRAIEASVQAAAPGTLVTFDAGRVPVSVRPDRPTREALLHIAREAVRNATKHAASKHAAPNAIEVTLEYNGRWRLTVRDEGAGFDAARAGNGFGLHSMRAHAHALGGVLNLTSAADGTTVEAVLP
ncbi:MAG TPA: ATP-binding protein [Solirubrobacteraceae bacterium]